jgi:hypothetical protein
MCSEQPAIDRSAIENQRRRLIDNTELAGNRQRRGGDVGPRRGEAL